MQNNNQKESEELSKEQSCPNRPTDHKTHNFLNICTLAFVGILMATILVAYFVSLAKGNIVAAYSIVGTYTLCMLLVTASLKLFIDTTNIPLLKKLNTIAVVLILVTIAILAVTVSFSYAEIISLGN
ncbi:MAG: hypothetical protein FWD86_02170 [Firmicutes bacterium]|nr:hypothetical protein [Bacillota bacterium]